MVNLTDVNVQEKLQKAENLLWLQLESQAMDDNPRLWIVFTVLRSVRIYSKSSNSTPGYMGLGLSEVISLADSIIENPPKSDRDVSVQSYKHIATSIKVKPSKDQ